MDNHNLFKGYMTALGEIHSKEITDVIKDIYWKSLKDFSDESCENAFKRAIAELKFFPKPAELIEFASGKSGSIDDIAMVEADKVINAMRHVGAYKSVMFDDPVTSAVINQGYGGWIKICNERMEDDNKWFRIEFIKIYKAYAARGVKYTGKLIGIHEDSNLQLGYDKEVQDPILIGDFDNKKLLN